MCERSLLDDMYEAVEKDIYESDRSRHLFDNKAFMAIGVIESVDLIMHRWKREGSIDYGDLKGLRNGMLKELRKEINKKEALH